MSTIKLPRLLCVDPGKVCGVSLFVPKSCVVSHGDSQDFVCKIRYSITVHQKMKTNSFDVYSFLKSINFGYFFDKLIIEDQFIGKFGKSNQTTVFNLVQSKSYWIVLYELIMSKIGKNAEIIQIKPTTWQSYMMPKFGKDKNINNKKKSIELCNKLCGIKTNDHVADSIMMGIYYLNNFWKDHDILSKYSKVSFEFDDYIE